MYCGYVLCPCILTARSIFFFAEQNAFYNKYNYVWLFFFVIQEKISEYERQIQQLEDEKEEVISERDYYSGKCDSLLKCLNEERSAQKPSHSTIQSLVEENHKLKMELVEAQAERDHAFSRIERYKKAIERQRAIEMAANQGLEGGDKKQDLRQTMKRVKELEGLANSLSGSVKEKSLALTHQKKANKMLGKRIAELEHRLKVLEISGLWSNPDSLLPKVDQPPLSPEIITSSEVSDTHTTTNTDTDDRTLGEEVSETCPPKSNSSIIKESPGHSTIVNLA